MIDQNLHVTKTISQELTEKELNLSIEQIFKYADSYNDAIVEFKNKHFEDRSQIPFFTNYMNTILNNFVRLIELGVELEAHFGHPNFSPTLSRNIRRLEKFYTQLRNESGKYLLEEIFSDLNKHFDELFTSRSLGTSSPVVKICATLENYFQDYNRLLEVNFKFVIKEACLSIVKRYILAMFGKRVVFKTYQECEATANQVLIETEHLKKVFVPVLAEIEDDDPFQILIMFAEVLKIINDMLSFDLHRLVEKYPDVTED